MRTQLFRLMSRRHIMTCKSDGRRYVRDLEAVLRREIDDADDIQELIFVLVCAKVLDELMATPRLQIADGDANSLGEAVDEAYAWLEKTTGETWPNNLLSRSLLSELQPVLANASLLLTAGRRQGQNTIQAAFEAIGPLLDGSRLSREPGRTRLLDAVAFRKTCRRRRSIAVAAAKALGCLPLLKQRNLDFMRGNHKRGDLILSNFPKLIHVELSTACNIRCRTCSITRPGRARDRGFIQFETLERLRPALPFITDCKLHGGGEPFLHPRIEEVLQVFRDEGVRLNTVTNANLVTERLGRLIGETFSTLTVSVDGVDRETYEHVRVRGKWDKLLRGIDFINRFRSSELKLIIGVVMLKDNIHQLPDLVRFAKDHGADELQAAWLVPFHDLPWTQDQRLTDDPNRTNHYMAETRQTGKDLGISVRIPDDLRLDIGVRLSHQDTYHNLHGTTSVEGHCRLMYDRAMILVDGRVKPCGQSRTVPQLGSIHARSFAACWNGSGYQRLRATFNGGTLPRTCMSCNFIRSNQTGTARLVYEKPAAA